MRALDFYSGIGGWAAGLGLAGIEVVASYERWAPAIATNQFNNRHPVMRCDIRKLDFSTLPDDIDIVVGSPPCTQFSFSNRGGKGDIEDGLRDVRTFLRIVKHLRPKAWVMENVPRLAGIFAEEFQAGGRLAEFADLKHDIIVLDCADFGLPQRRKRCLVGNIDFDLLKKYADRAEVVTLGDVVTALQKDEINDPNFDLKLPKALVSDNEYEEPLSVEETRLNHSMKQLHPIYNAMPFPDTLSRASRTVTATCTRVSRESIVVRHPEDYGYRRLTVRERASLQGFPISFQFQGVSFAQKERMVGNAMPPVLSYFISCAIKSVEPADLQLPSALNIAGPIGELGTQTPTSKVGKTFQPKRRFRFSIPSLHLKSGVRFELANSFPDGLPRWQIDFFYGPSKKIQQIRIDHRLEKIVKHLREDNRVALMLEDFEQYVEAVDFTRLQDLWSHRGPGGTRPLDLLDQLSLYAAKLACLFQDSGKTSDLALLIDEIVGLGVTVSVDKLKRNSSTVLSGLLLGSIFNRSASPEPYFGTDGLKAHHSTPHRSLSSSCVPMSLPETVS